MKTLTETLEALMRDGIPPVEDDFPEALPNWSVYSEPKPPTAEQLEEWRLADIAANKRRAIKANWPERALDAAWGSLRETMAVTRMATWSPDKNVAVLAGPPGLGKTVAVAAWMKNDGRTLRFLRSSEFATMSRYDEDSRSSIYNAEGLCLDDLGAEYMDNKGSFLVDLDQLVDTYYGNKRPLVITTNLTSAEFKKRYGNRVEDRIRECGEWMTITGQSLRGPGV